MQSDNRLIARPNRRYWPEGVNALIIEIDAGLAFSALALNTGDRNIRIRNLALAARVYATAQRWLKDLRLSAADYREIEAKLARLSGQLTKLGAGKPADVVLPQASAKRKPSSA